MTDIRDIELDVCANGHGSWLDRGDIEAFLRTKRDLQSYIPYASRRWAESALKCPLRQQSMQTLRR